MTGPRQQNAVIGRGRALLAHLTGIGKNNLRLPVVVAYLPRHTEALARKRGLGVPNFARSSP
jgi:hypothetical protein